MTFSSVIFIIILTLAHGMSSLQPTDNRNCVDIYIASDGESSDDEDEEALLVERTREILLRESPFYMCLSTLDERDDRMYSYIPWPDPDDEVDLRVLKAAVQGEIVTLRELHGQFSQRLKRARNEYGWTALHLAAFYGHAAMVVEMTSTDHFGLPPDKRSRYGWTPVMAAAWGGREEIVKYLLKDLQCNVNIRDIDGRNLLFVCAGSGNLQLVRWFVQEYDPNIILTQDGSNVLIPAAQSGEMSLFEWLVEKYKLNPSEAAKDEVQHPFRNALLNGHLELAKHIVRKYGTAVKGTAKENALLLRFAAASGKKEIVNWLTEEYSFDFSVKDSNGWSVLHEACRYGRQELLQHLLSLSVGLDPRRPDRYGRSCLHMAIEEGHVGIVKELLTSAACELTRVESPNGQPPVVIAAAGGRRAMLEFLIDHYNFCTPQDSSKNGDTPLLMAVHNGHLAVVKMLIEKYQCSANEVYKMGTSPVTVAALRGHVHILKLLDEQYNGNLFHTDAVGANALHCAAFGGHLPCVKYLAAKLGDRKFDLNMQAESCLHRAVEGGSLKVVQYLIDKCGLDPNLQNGSNLDCLMLACCHGRGRIVCELIERYSMNQHSVSEDGKTLLHYAAENGHRECMKLLVHQYKFDPDKADSKGQTVLHISSSKGDVEMMKFILEQFNPDLEAVEESGLTPLHCAFAAGENCAAVVRVLAKDYHANMDANMPLGGAKPLHLAALKDNMDVMRILITECGCKADLRDEDGRTILHYAAGQGHLSATRTLVKEFKVDPDVVDKNGCTPLMAATKAGEVDCMRVLVKELGCNKDAQDKEGVSAIYLALTVGPAMARVMLTEFQCNPKLLPVCGETLLHGCATFGYSELLKELVTQYHLDINQPNLSGETPLHYATQARQLDAVKQLKELNCDVTACNESGMTAVDLALQGDSDAMVAALLD